MPAPDSDNPFALLAGRKWPDPKQKTNREEEDRQLFLQAVDKLPVKTSPGGFTLGEQCQMPKIRPHKPSPPVAPRQPDPPAAEENIFLTAMRNVSPLTRKGREVARRPQELKVPQPAESSFEDLLSGQFNVFYSDEYLEGWSGGKDDAALQRLKQGSLRPEAHLDLHGLNSLQAFESLRVFMRDSWFKGLRVVLLVPGRGKNSPNGMGILRQKIPQWLTHEPFRRAVLAFCTAQPHDGGPGSIYVLLRRTRKKGRIHWDVMPPDADLYD